MKNILIACSCLFVFFAQAQITTSSQWTWVKGDNIINQFGIYGTQGTADVANKPGGRDGSIKWTDGSGNFWLFGGSGYTVSGIAGKLNDLWKYNIVTNEWTWMKGDNSRNKVGIYGTLSVADAANKPGGRDRSVSWTDPSGNFWLFGGSGNAAVTGMGRLNDLWKYDIVTNEWTWMKGDNSINQWGVYGTQGVADAANKPGAREYTVSWADASGNLWLFGGFGWDEVGNTGVLSDLWKYNIATGEWTWMKGDKIPYQSGVYGTPGTPDAANNPGSRQRHKSWIDGSGSFWIFGGSGYDQSGFSGSINALWKYNTVTNEWTWMKGDNSRNQLGVYGTQGVADVANKAGSRSYPLSWMDGSGNLWIFGGSGYDGINAGAGSLNDMWKLSVDLITLPLQLLEFNGRLQNGNALLNWKTENEQHASHFEIERSTDGRNYTAIANVVALNQPGFHNYTYTDNNVTALTAPVVYYRLRQKDTDGKFTYSRIIALPLHNSNVIVLFYPNPVTNEANLAITVSSPEKLQVKIADNAGRIIKQQQLTVAAGSTSLPVDVSGLTKGIYFLELKGETVNERKPFVKL